MAREVGRVVGIFVIVGVGVGVVTALVEDGESVGVLVAKEDTSIEMTVVGLGIWKPADAARDDSLLAVVAGGMITLVLLSVNLETELAELLDKEERLWELGVGVRVDKLAVGLRDTKPSPAVELELLGAVIVANDEVLGVLASDVVIAEPADATPSPVTCTSGCDKVALVLGERSPFGLAGGVTNELLEDLELLSVESEDVKGVCEASWELDWLESESIVDDDVNDIEELRLDDENVEVVDSVGVGVFVFDSVVGPTGIIVRMSGTEEELEVSEV